MIIVVGLGLFSQYVISEIYWVELPNFIIKTKNYLMNYNTHIKNVLPEFLIRIFMNSVAMILLGYIIAIQLMKVA